MTVLSLSRRVDRLGIPMGAQLSLAEALERLRAQEAERRKTWKAVGNTGRLPPEPPTPIEPWCHKATHAEATLWERLAWGRARVAHHRCVPSSPFRDFRDIYTMSEADLVSGPRAHNERGPKVIP